MSEQNFREQKTRLICSDGFMIFLLQHITFISPESKYENDDDVTEIKSLVMNMKAKVGIF